MEYYLTGPGADKPPFNLFVVDHNTGFIRITGRLDREDRPYFNVSFLAILLFGKTDNDQNFSMFLGK